MLFVFCLKISLISDNRILMLAGLAFLLMYRGMLPDCNWKKVFCDKKTLTF